MNESTPAPNSISYKKLNSLLKTANIGIRPKEASTDNNNAEKDQFNLISKEWSDASKELLKVINSNKKIISQNRSPNAIMALGAMEVHINMAIQALKAFEYNQD